MASKVEVGFELTVGDTPYFRLNDPVKGKLDNVSYRLAGPIWIDISDKVSSVSIKRGKNRELDRYSSAAASIALHNEDRTFDPLNTASPYVGNIIPRRSVRVSTAGVTQFTGVIEDWNLDYDVSGKSNAVIQAADAFTLLAQQSLTAGTATSELTGARVNAVLSQPSVAWPLANRQIDAGNSLLGADVFDGNVLSYLQQVEASEQGQLFMSKGGDVRFVNGSTSRSSGTWTLTGTNLVTNPSMETQAIGTNLVSDPSFEAGTTGWAVLGSCTIARSTTYAHSGTYSLKVDRTGTGDDFAFRTFTGLTASTNYVVSAWVYLTGDGATNANRGPFFFGPTGGTTFAPNYDRTKLNQWQRIYAVVNSGTGAAIQLRFYAMTGFSVYVDDVMITVAPTGTATAVNGALLSAETNPYAILATARTNLITNPNFEAETTGWAASGATMAVSTVQKYIGTQSLLVTPSGTGTDGVYINISAGRITGRVYTASAWIYTTVTRNVRLLITNGSVPSPVSIPANTWTRISTTFTAVSSTNFLWLEGSASGTQPFYVDAVMFEESATLRDYFDGTFGSTTDLTTAWTGAANASTSVMVGVPPATQTGSAAGAIQSTEWAGQGTKSLRIVPTGTNASYSSSTWTGLTVGQLYTVLGTVRLTAALTGTLNANALKITTDSPTVTLTSTASNVAGTYVVRGTFTATATSHTINLWNGASAGNGEVWWDQFLLIAGTYTSTFFDGATVPADDLSRYAWTGTVNASTSTKEQLISEDILQFADDGTGIPYTNASVSYGTELLYNQVAVTYPGGTVTAGNTESQTQYGISATEVDTLLSNSTQAQTLADFWVSKYGQPEYRFQELTVNLTSLTGAQQAQILDSELGDIISVKFTPNGVGDPIERNGQIVAIGHNIGIDRHDITYGFAAVPFTFFVLNDEGYGILDSSALGF